MFKRAAVFILLITIILLMAPLGALAYHTDKITDDLNYLTAEEANAVQDLIDQTIQKHNLDVGIVITDDTQGKPSMMFADDYYDYNGFGIGEDHSGLLLLINMQAREIWISTTGKAIPIFTDARIDSMADVVAASLSAGNFYDGCIQFVEEVAYYAEQGVPAPSAAPSSPGPGVSSGQVSTEKEPYLNRVQRQMASPYVYIGAAIVALIATVIASVSMKGRVTINNQTYEEGGSFVLSESRDDFIRESTSRVALPKNDNNNIGGSSTHTGSSGRTHGGGGRSF